MSVQADLDETRASAALEDGVIPVEVAEWVADGANPDLHPNPDDTDTPAVRAGRWQISDDEAATWAMRRLAAATVVLDELDDRFSRERALLSDWRESAGRAARNTVEFMSDRLGAYALAKRAADPACKSLVTPAGKVTTRQPSEPWRVVVADPSAFTAWAFANDPDLLRLSPDMSAVRKGAWVPAGDGVARVDTGEVVPGVTWEETQVTYSVQPVKP